MLTSVQLRDEIYTAVTSNVTLQGYLGNPMRLHWLGRVTVEDTFPKAIYSKIDAVGDYAFGVDLQAESLVYEVRIYTDTQDASALGYKIDLINDSLKTSMHGIGYMLIGSSAELLDESINKIVSITRWERINA